MNLLELIARATSKRKSSAAANLVACVSQSLGLPATRDDNGSWCVLAERRDTYRVSLHMWVLDSAVHLMAASQVMVERDLLPRELLLFLLEENHRCQDGAFRLVPKGTDRYVVLGRVVDCHSLSEAGMKSLATALIGRMQQTITTLYARELIISGPDR